MSVHRWRGGLSLLGLSLLAAASFAGCGKVESSRGGLMLLVSTDGPVAIDRVDITIAATDRDLLANKYRVPEEVSLPTTVAIVSNGDPTAQATISVTGWAGSVPVDRRDAIVTQIPTERVAALNVVLSARCTPKLSVGFDGNAVSDCGDGNTCNNAGYCVTATIQAQDLPTYRAGDENDAGFAGAASEDPQGGTGGGGGTSGGPVVIVGDAAGAGGSAGSGADGGAGGAEDGGAGGAGGAWSATCGNHQIEPGEQCDDGNTLSADGCSADCKFECGNLKIDPGEVCDDGNTLPADGCSADCRSGESCGNGILDLGETCDDGNGILTDNCVDQTPSSCKLATCGDGFIDSAAPGIEACDDAGESKTCNRDCTKARCGDKITNQTAGEECDDGGETARCNADCKSSRCGDHVTNAASGEQCDSGAIQTATCEATCKTPRCGDLTKNPGVGEQCDDGGVQSSICEANCKLARCGDSIVNKLAGEACDSGGVQTASCEANCQVPRCGDSILNPSTEQCDPPNTAKCDANCKAK